ncbi:MAG: hypothetical protein K9J12_13375 [Melioribacteraceae bacterium]|nr:hypothetical protein [Melioribacteraceae bacterium]MCF8264281.1 hypothetical protein [Melioribacteraceae bacterium]MCF8412837.1 hypothetical protein [Melioribacteraceae bacterium]MCF8431316.1 hypothetical protein [Melioribacteraceae bacterium]
MIKKSILQTCSFYIFPGNLSRFYDVLLLPEREIKSGENKYFTSPMISEVIEIS